MGDSPTDTVVYHTVNALIFAIGLNFTLILLICDSRACALICKITIYLSGVCVSDERLSEYKIRCGMWNVCGTR